MFQKMIIFAAVLFGFSAQAKTMVCASNGEQTIYYAEGRLTLSAEVVNSLNLKDIQFTVLPKDKLWSREARATGQARGNWIRFEIGGDSWCSYRASVPGDFATRGGSWFPAFVDAFCEENTNSNHRLNCRLR